MSHVRSPSSCNTPNQTSSAVASAPCTHARRAWRARAGFLSTLQNPLYSTAMLVALNAKDIVRAFSSCAVFEIEPPDTDQSSEYGTAILTGQRFRLRHIGTNHYVCFDPTEVANPLCLQDQASDSPERDAKLLLSFGSVLKTKSSTAPINGNDQVKLVANGNRALHFQVNPATMQGEVHHTEHRLESEHRDIHATKSSAGSRLCSVCRIQAFHKYNPSEAELQPTHARACIGTTVRVFHSEDESYLAACGSADLKIQPGGKQPGLVKRTDGSMSHCSNDVVHSSNEVFVIVNSDLSRRHLGGVLRSGDVYRLYNLASAKYLALDPKYFQVGDEVTAIADIKCRSENESLGASVLVVSAGARGSVESCGFSIVVQWQPKVGMEPSQPIEVSRNQIAKHGLSTRSAFVFCNRDDESSMANSFFQMQTLSGNENTGVFMVCFCISFFCSKSYHSAGFV